MKKFDVVVGNPPYAKKVGPTKTEPIWHLFAEKTLQLVKNNGYLSTIHPAGWRNADGKYSNIKNIYLNKKILALDLNDSEKGRKVFGAVTTYDIVTLKNTQAEIGYKTKIIDNQDNIHHLDVSKLPFIPNSNFDEILSLVATSREKKVEVIYSSSDYEIRNSYMSNEKTEKFRYPCVYTITQKSGINLRYSSKNNGHFGIPKVIWSNGTGTYPLIDSTGEYGLTQFSYGIVDEPENLENIRKAMSSDKFLDLMKSIKFKNDIYDYRVIAIFRKDFWKEFI